MTDLTTTYLGLLLRNPLVASASPLTENIDTLRVLEDHGVAAVVLPSLFEEDIARDQLGLDPLLDAGEGVSEVCGGYFPAIQRGHGVVDRYLALVDRAGAALDIPVVASLNGASNTGWVDLATQIAAAGARAIELNLYHLALDLTQSASDVEETAISLVRRVRAAVDVPLAIKLTPYYSAFGQMAKALATAGADGLVLFNRLYHPDVNLRCLCAQSDPTLSHRHEMRLPMMWLAALRGRIPVSLAATTGVESADDVVRYLLAGADTVMSTSALLRHGPEYAASLVDGLTQWLEAREFNGANDIRGLLAHGNDAQAGLLERAAYPRWA